jgi:tetratricopeptide (TPR) repeat protein
MEKDISIIEDYLTGQLSEEQRKTVEKRIREDAEFKQKYEFEKQLFDTFNDDSWNFADKNDPALNSYKATIHSDDFQKIKESIAEAGKDHEPEKLNRKNNRSWILYVAAAVVIVLIAVQVLLKDSVTNEELYYTYINLDDLPSFVIRNEAPKHTLAKAENFFEQKNYEASIALFKDILIENEKDSRVYIYLGIAYTESGNYDKATKIFNQLIASDLLDAEKGYWYKALLYLKMNDEKASKSVLETIIANKYYNAEQAAELLDKF